MEIVDIDTEQVLGDVTPETIDEPLRWLYTFVRVHTDEGITGVGEATVPLLERAAAMAVEDVGRRLIGADPLNVEGLWEQMYQGYAWTWGPISMAAISGIEMALWDIVGKHHGVRVCDLLGGPRDERVKVYSNGWWHTTMTAEEFVRGAERQVADGHDVLKIDPFIIDGEKKPWLNRDDLRTAANRVATVRDAVGDSVEIALDSHGVFSPRGAIEAAKAVEPYEPLFIEEPVPPENYDAFRRLEHEIAIPIATGERLLTTFDYRDLFRNEVPVDVVQPDVAHCGGISQLKKIAALAYSEYVPVAPHNSYGPVATAAAAHAVSTVPNFFVLEYFPNSPDWREQMTVGSETVTDGWYYLPDGPGLGVELDLDEIRSRPSERPPGASVPSYTDSYRSFWE